MVGGRLRNLSSGRLREFLEQYLTEKQAGYLQSGSLREVVANEKWSLGGGWPYTKMCIIAPDKFSVIWCHLRFLELPPDFSNQLSFPLEVREVGILLY